MKLLVALAVSASAASLRGIVTEVLYAKEGRTQMEIDVKTFQNPRGARVGAMSPGGGVAAASRRRRGGVARSFREPRSHWTPVVRGTGFPAGAAV